MNQVVEVFIVFLLGHLWFAAEGLEVIPERGAMVYSNPQYVTSFSVNVRRYSRRSPYFMNVNFTNIHTWANNVTAEFIFYEYLHNEYRPSFVEKQYKLCDMFHDPIFGSIIKSVSQSSHLSLTCPMPPQIYNLANITFLSIPFIDNFPYKWPFEKGKLLIILRTYPKGVKIAEGYFIATFKQPLVYKNKS